MFVVHVIVALLEVILVEVGDTVMIGAEASAQLLVTKGVTVYTVDPVVWDSVAVSMPPLQDTFAIPPALEVATERSYEGDKRVKLPPVVCESVTNTLVAFTVRASAAELVAIVSVVGYEESVIDSAVEKLSWAAEAWKIAPPERAIRKNAPHNIRFCFI